MASADLRAELDCPVCLSIYTDPVMLKCGHNFCQDCIDHVLDRQEESGVYTCPQCREEFQERPVLQRNLILRNITQRFLPVQLEQKESGIFCTYCIHTSVPAVKSCLLCEASLCDNHLRVHSKSPEHVLCDPTTSLESRKCSVHEKVLQYYCTEDSTCICLSCSLVGEHRGHLVETMQEAFVNQKKKLINNLQKLMIRREMTEKRVQSLHECREKVQGKANGETERFTTLFRALRRKLEDLEKSIVSGISRRAGKLLGPLNDLIQQLEIKKDELSKKIRHFEEICNMMDPLTVLQGSDTGDLCDTEDGDDEDRERHDRLLNGGDLDVTGNSQTFRTGLSDIITSAYVGIYIDKTVGLSLDEDTAHNVVCISDDKKTVSRSHRNQNRPFTYQRFTDYNQVLSTQSFSAGRHYWEVSVGASNNWRIGMCYSSIDRKGDGSLIGSNDVSWALYRRGDMYKIVHDRNEISLSDYIPGTRVWIYLDYEAGQISFYMLDPIQCLHTFTATFTEPLHAVLGIWHSYISLS